MTVLIEKALLLSGQRADIQIEGNEITAINPKKKDKTGIVINGKKMAAVPSFFNMHSHAAMTLFKGYGDDFELHEWLEKFIFPAEEKLTPKDVFNGSMLACIEMIHSGITCFNDMYYFEIETAKAAEKTGLRAVLSRGLSGKSFSEQTAVKSVKELKKFKNIIPALGPHAIYTVDEFTLCEINRLAAELNVPIHFHLSETKKELDDCMEEKGKRPAEFLESIGFLSNRLFNAHCVWLDDAEIKLLAENKAMAITCPTSNLKLASGVAPVKEMLSSGIKVMLGTDGSASNNSLNFFESMKLASLTQKHSHYNPTVLPASQVFEMATVNAAQSLSLKAGEIKEGFLADLNLIDLNHVSMVPCHNLASNLVFSAEPGCVDTVICNGNLLMQGKEIKGEEKIKEKAAKAAEKLVLRE